MLTHLFCLVIFALLSTSESLLTDKEKFMLLSIYLFRNNDKKKEIDLLGITEKNKKCKYTKKLLNISPNICSVPPENTYKSIYNSSYKTQMWNYYQTKCIEKEIDTFEKIVVVICFCCLTLLFLLLKI